MQYQIKDPPNIVGVYKDMTLRKKTQYIAADKTEYVLFDPNTLYFHPPLTMSAHALKADRRKVYNVGLCDMRVMNRQTIAPFWVVTTDDTIKRTADLSTVKVTKVNDDVGLYQITDQHQAPFHLVYRTAPGGVDGSMVIVPAWHQLGMNRKLTIDKSAIEDNIRPFSLSILMHPLRLYKVPQERDYFYLRVEHQITAQNHEITMNGIKYDIDRDVYFNSSLTSSPALHVKFSNDRNVAFAASLNGVIFPKHQVHRMYQESAVYGTKKYKLVLDKTELKRWAKLDN